MAQAVHSMNLAVTSFTWYLKLTRLIARAIGGLLNCPMSLKRLNHQHMFQILRKHDQKFILMKQTWIQISLANKDLIKNFSLEYLIKQETFSSKNLFISLQNHLIVKLKVFSCQRNFFFGTNKYIKLTLNAVFVIDLHLTRLCLRRFTYFSNL